MEINGLLIEIADIMTEVLCWMSRRSLTYVVIHLFARNEERSQTLILLK